MLPTQAFTHWSEQFQPKATPSFCSNPSTKGSRSPFSGRNYCVTVWFSRYGAPLGRIKLSSIYFNTRILTIFVSDKLQTLDGRKNTDLCNFSYEGKLDDNFPFSRKYFCKPEWKKARKKERETVRMGSLSKEGNFWFEKASLVALCTFFQFAWKLERTWTIDLHS